MKPGARAAEAADLLARLPGLAGGRVVKLLADGPTNRSWLVEAGGARYVLRLDRPEAAALGLDRDNEYRVSETIAAAGLTPPWRHVDRAAGACLRPYVAGRSLSPGDLAEPGTLARLAAVLRRLHGVAPAGRRFDPVAAAQRYADHLGTVAARRLARRAESILARAGPAPAPPALCHNDLVSSNILRTEDRGLLLIDWEYAGIGDPYFDLAVIVRHHGLDGDRAAHFLAAYLGRPPCEAERSHLARQCDFYGVLLELWNQRIAL